MAKKVIKSIDKLTKEDCERLLQFATPEELESYKAFGDSWQMGLAMSGIWANHSEEAFSFENSKSIPAKKQEVAKNKETTEIKPQDQDQEHHTDYHHPCEVNRSKKELKEPDFDFHDFYEIGQKVHIVKCFPTLGKYEVLPVKIRSIWPRLMIGTVEGGYAECMDYDMKDNLHTNPLEAVEQLKELKEKFPPKKYTTYDAMFYSKNDEE